MPNVWFQPEPGHWIRCTEIHPLHRGLFGVTLYGVDARQVVNLRQRRVGDAIIVME